MSNKEAVKIVDDMILQVTESMELNELWCSRDIYDALGVEKYKGYRILTHKLMPKKEYAVIGGRMYI